MPVYQKGKAAADSFQEGHFLKVSADESVTFVPLVGLDDMVSAKQHEFWDTNPAFIAPCVGRGCPACALGNTPRFKAFLPIQTKEGQSKIYAFGIKVYRQLEEIESELGTIQGKVLKVRRSGQGRNTSYTIIATGKTAKLDNAEPIDLLSVLGDETKESMTAKLVDRGMLDAPTTTNKRQQSRKVDVEDDEEASDAGWEEA